MANIFIKSVAEAWQKIKSDVDQFFGGEVSIERAVSIPHLYSQVMQALDTLDPSTYYNIIDIYVDTNEVFALLVQRGKLYRIPVFVDADSLITIGELVEVVVDFKPVTARSLTIKRQADGSTRWFMLTGTSVLNRDGEIDSSILFDNFIQRIEATGEYPYIDYYHLGKTFRLGTADYAARDGVVLLASGVFDDTEIAQAMLRAYEADPDYWGASIEYASTEAPTMLRITDDINIPVYTAGVWVAISVVAEEDACSLFTRFIKERTMKPRVQAALKKLAGDDEELLKSLVLTVDTVNRTVEEEDLIRRAKSEDVTTDDTTDTTTDAVVEPTSTVPDVSVDDTAGGDAEFVLDETAVAAIADVVMERLLQQTQPIVDALQEVQTANADTVSVMRTLQDAVAKLQQIDEKKQKEWLADLPRSNKARVAVTYRPRDVDEDADEDVADEKSDTKVSYADVAADTLEGIK